MAGLKVEAGAQRCCACHGACREARWLTRAPTTLLSLSCPAPLQSAARLPHPT